MDQIVQIFKALGDETRLKILLILVRRRICAKGLSKHLNISEAAISQHIKILKDAGIIVGVKVGYYVHYDIQEQVLLELIKFIEHMNDDHIMDLCKSGINIPNECRATCKSDKNRCCQKIKD